MIHINVLNIFDCKKCLVFIFLIWLVGLFVALLSPVDVLSNSEFLGNYVSLMKVLVSPKNLIASRSSFPEVSAFYHFIVIWSFPLLLFTSLRWMNKQVGINKNDMLFKARLSLKDKLILILLMPFWLFLAYAAFFLNHGGDTRMFAFGTSRVQLAVFGMLFSICMALVLSVVIFSVRRLFNSH